MLIDKAKDTKGLFSSVFIAYSILILHIILIGAVMVLVLFFRGVINYMWLILFGGFGMLCLIGFMIYWKIKRDGRAIAQAMSSPDLKGRNFEIRFLGGLASFKLGRSNEPLLIDTPTFKQLEHLPEENTSTVKQLQELAQLFENNLITIEEFNQAKASLFKANDRNH